MKPKTGIISTIQRFSIHDGPGIRTTVFFKGCPLHCRWCSNPELILPSPEIMIIEEKCLMCGRCVEICPLGAIDKPHKIDRSICDGCGRCTEVCPSVALLLIGKPMTVEEIIEEVQKDVIFYRRSGGGITLSGGEAINQWAFARALLMQCKQLNIHTAIETSGFADWKSLHSVSKHCDLILYDIKIMDRHKHVQYTGVPNDLLLANVRRLMQTEVNLIIRVPLIPRYNTTKENIARTARFATEIGVREIHLLPFHQYAKSKYTGMGKDYALRNLRPPSDRLIQRLAKVVTSHGLSVQIGG